MMFCNGCETQFACNTLGYCQNRPTRKIERPMSLTPEQERMIAKLGDHENNRDNLLIGIAGGVELLLRQSHNDGKAHHTADILAALRKKFEDSR